MWEVKDGALTVVVVESFPAKGKVVSIDDKSQFLEMEAGAEVRKTRVKE